MEYLGMAILVIATLAVIALPIIKKDASGEEPEYVDLDLAKLQEEKESAYNALKEADFDYQTGKLSDEDYAAVTTKYRDKAMEALHKLEEYQGSGIRDQRSDDRLEETATSGKEKTSIGQEAAEPAQKAKKEVAHNFCGECGTKLPKDAKFCGSCGSKI